MQAQPVKPFSSAHSHATGRAQEKLLPQGARAPARRYLDWHRQKIFVA